MTFPRSLTYGIGALLASVALAAPAAAQAPAPPTGPTLTLAFNPDSSVTLSARNVTVRQILTEWAHQCGCYVLNADRLMGAPLAIPIEFDRAPQAAVLESLLRGAAGYVLAPKRPGSTSLSNYETIYILATSSPSAAAYVPTNMPVAAPLLTPGSPDDEIPPVIPQAPPRAPTAPPPAPAPAPAASTPPPNTAGTPGAFVPAVQITPVGPSTQAAPPAPAAGSH